MKKFFALYMAPVAEIEKMMATYTEEQSKEDMEKWRAWMKNHEKDFADPGQILGKTKRVTANGISDAKNDVTGYSIVQAESHEEAAKLFLDMPHFEMPGAYVDVLSVTEMS